MHYVYKEVSSFFWRKTFTLLFTNFSPTHFFAKNGIDVNDFQIKEMTDWRVEEYSFSAGLYHHICKNYSIVEVHFVTSVIKRVVNDIDFLNVTGSVQTYVNRKQDWMKPGMIYNAFLKLYLLEKVTDAVRVLSDKRNI